VGFLTNGAFAKTEQDVQDFISQCRFLPTKKQVVRLLISCDKFHQTQKATPLENIINIISVLEKDRPAGFEYVIRAVYDPVDDTFDKVLVELQQKGIIPDNVLKHKVEIPLEYVGRAKTRIGGFDPELKQENYFTNTGLLTQGYVTVTGKVVLCENWVGEELLPFGNIKNETLVEIEDNLNSFKILKLFCIWPKKFFFYPFRKYLDLQNFCLDLSCGKIKNAYYLRDKAVKILRMKEKQFDFSAELKEARQVYSNTHKLPIADCLDIIERYGDLSDVFYLRELSNKTTDIAVLQKILMMFKNTYSVN
jgi:hypothetical protein